MNEGAGLSRVEKIPQTDEAERIAQLSATLSPEERAELLRRVHRMHRGCECAPGYRSDVALLVSMLGRNED